MRGYNIYIDFTQRNNDIYIYNTETEQLDCLVLDEANFATKYEPVDNIFDKDIYNYASFLNDAQSKAYGDKTHNISGYEVTFNSQGESKINMTVNNCEFVYDVYEDIRSNIQRLDKLNDYMTINQILQANNFDFQQVINNLLDKYNIKVCSYDEVTELLTKKFNTEINKDSTCLETYNLKCCKDDFTDLGLYNTEIAQENCFEDIKYSNYNKFMNYKIPNKEDKVYLYSNINLALIPYLSNVNNSINILLNKLKYNSSGFTSINKYSFDTILENYDYDITNRSGEFITLTAIADNILGYIFSGQIHKHNNIEHFIELYNYESIIYSDHKPLCFGNPNYKNKIKLQLCGLEGEFTVSDEGYVSSYSESLRLNKYLGYHDGRLPKIQIKEIIKLLEDIRDNSYNLYRVLEHIARKDVYILLSELMKSGGSRYALKFKTKFKRLPLYKEIFYKILLEEDQLMGNIYEDDSSATIDTNLDDIHLNFHENNLNIKTTELETEHNTYVFYTDTDIGEYFNKYFKNYKLVENTKAIFESYKSNNISKSYKENILQDRNVFKLNSKGLVYHIINCLEKGIGLSKPSDAILNLISCKIDEYSKTDKLGLYSENHTISLNDFIKAVEINLNSYGKYEEDLNFKFEDYIENFDFYISNIKNIFDKIGYKIW